MSEKNYIIKCEHHEDDKDCLSKESCAIHCHNNKNGKCVRHCDKSWQCDTEAQADTLKHTHIANESLHTPKIRRAYGSTT